MSARLDAQMAFLMEADRLKSITRATRNHDGRFENSAEHSWHLALYALVLAPFAKPGTDIDRVIQMLLLHDLVEIDAGDHPIGEEHDWEAVAQAETAAAKRLFGLLPDDQAQALHAIWAEFEAGESQEARFAKQLDHCQPIFQTLCANAPIAEHIDVVRGNLFGGRAMRLNESFPQAYQHACHLLQEPSEPETSTFSRHLRFLNEADQLKTIQRATMLGDGSRRENSAEHSWHIMLYAWVLGEYSEFDIQIGRVLRMLLLHDLVEIDAGDCPIHGHIDADAQAAIEAREQAAAERLFGLLPEGQAQEFMALWQEFEAAQSADAIFAKSIDRVQPVLLNLLNGGGSWLEYNVSFQQLEDRVGQKVRRGAAQVWHHVLEEVTPWFAQQGRI